ncbi:RluA family pseudouridine synthase [candidate division KSB1 bacterium]|nr:RluA family pseudouridine synthase [candidate division KSB1 bacterium]
MQTTIKQTISLAKHLCALYPSSSKNSIKKLLEHDRVKVNGVITRIGKTQLQAGDRVEIGEKVFVTRLPEDLEILYEDEHLLVINKKANLLTIATEKEKEATVYAYLSAYVKTQQPDNKIFIVHRLDKKASGILVFARSEEVKRKLQAQFEKYDIERRYIAIVEGRVKDESGTAQNYLAENRAYKVYVTDDKQTGKLAITNYRVEKRTAGYTWLEITTQTGRKHQIRVHLAGLGHPVIGDKEYGSKKNPLQRLGLHACRLGFVHPVSGKKMTFEVDAPPAFRKMFSR